MKKTAYYGLVRDAGGRVAARRLRATSMREAEAELTALHSGKDTYLEIQTDTSEYLASRDPGDAWSEAKWTHQGLAVSRP